MISLAEQKYHIIRLIFIIDNPGLLNWLEEELLKKQKDAATTTNGRHAISTATELRSKLNRPLRQKLDPAMLKKAQGWKGHDEAALMEAIHELHVEEPIEELLAIISK